MRGRGSGSGPCGTGTGRQSGTMSRQWVGFRDLRGEEGGSRGRWGPVFLLFLSSPLGDQEDLTTRL